VRAMMIRAHDVAREYHVQRCDSTRQVGSAEDADWRLIMISLTGCPSALETPRLPPPGKEFPPPSRVRLRRLKLEGKETPPPLLGERRICAVYEKQWRRWTGGRRSVPNASRWVWSSARVDPRSPAPRTLASSASRCSAPDPTSARPIGRPRMSESSRGKLRVRRGDDTD
jgi:hypothetical protein